MKWCPPRKLGDASQNEEGAQPRILLDRVKLKVRQQELYDASLGIVVRDSEVRVERNDCANGGHDPCRDTIENWG